MRFLLLPLLVLSISAAAQAPAPLHFGDYAPLTNTRYGTIAGQPELVSNGTDTFLFWSTMNTIRVTRLVEYERRVSQVVMDTVPSPFDVVWTGRNFLVATSDDPQRPGITGRFLDANGNPSSSTFRLRQGARPRLASNGSRIAMTYDASFGVIRTAFFDANGVFASEVTIATGTSVTGYDVASNGDGFAAVVAGVDSVRIFRFDGSGALVSQSTATGPSRDVVTRDVAIASLGEEYLAVITERKHGVYAVRIAAAGTVSNPVQLENVGIATAPAVAAAGSHYVVGYVEEQSSTARFLRVARIPGAGTLIESAPAVPNARVSIALRGPGETLSAWSGAPFGAINLKLTGSTPGQALEASYGAAEQQLLDTATSATSTLFVWYELADDAARLYAGARDVNGDWNERLLGTNLGTVALAASNGSEYMVVSRDGSGWLAWRVGASGDPIGQRSRFTPVADVTFHDLAWNGQSYVLAGIDSQKRLVAALLDTGGRMSAPIVVREPRENIYLDKPSLASDGTNTLIAWSEIQPVPCFPICDFAIDGINYRMLGPSLVPLGDSPRQVVDNDAGEPHAVFAAGEFVIVWAQHGGAWRNPINISGARIARDGRRVDPVYVVAAEGYPSELDAVSMGDRIGVSWRQIANGNSVTPETRVRVIRSTGTLLSDATLPPQRTNATRLALLPGNRLAHAAAMQQSSAPHHGASRIVLAVGDVLRPPARPGAPQRMVAIVDGLNADLSWSPASGEVNGYRIEYRIGDGSWNEVERWLGPDELSTTVRLARTGLEIAFRVRAFNDGGAGGYGHSSGGAPRRRAVR